MAGNPVDPAAVPLPSDMTTEQDGATRTRSLTSRGLYPQTGDLPMTDVDELRPDDIVGWISTVHNDVIELKREFKSLAATLRQERGDAGRAEPATNSQGYPQDTLGTRTYNHCPPAPPPRPPYVHVPGQYPSLPRAHDARSDFPPAFQDTLDCEKAKIVSQYDAKIEALESQLEQQKSAFDDVQRKNVEISRQLDVQRSKVSNLSKTLTRAGRSESTTVDGVINQEFLVLKTDILRMVRHNLSLPKPPILHQDASADMAELMLRRNIALDLYNNFFHPKAMPFPFGYDERHPDWNSLRDFEGRLRAASCDDATVREWRVATIKACKDLPSDLDKFVRVVTNRIWNDGIKVLCRFSKRVSEKERREAWDELKRLCMKAAELAILFRGSSIEYQWEQDVDDLKSLKVDRSKEHDIIGTKRPDPNQCDESQYEIDFIVFGGVVRGDKATGLLRDGRNRLSKTQVVIRETGSMGY